MSSRRCNLRAISGKTHPNPEGVVRGKGRGRFSATVSVGCTYGYPRCLASQDSLPDWIWRTRHQRADARNEANLNHNPLCRASVVASDRFESGRDRPDLLPHAALKIIVKSTT